VSARVRAEEKPLGAPYSILADKNVHEGLKGDLGEITQLQIKNAEGVDP
jgi:hypothetical protein